MQFEWDIEKAAANFKKHEVSFDEAQTVFKDPFFIDFYDDDSEHEHRFSSENR